MTARSTFGVLLGFVLLARLASQADATVAPQEQEGGQDNCRACHLVLSDERLSNPARAFPNDIHAARGFGCVACHGGDATDPGLASMDPAKGFLAKPSRQQIAGFCGRCHSDATLMRRYNPSLRVDQVTEYASSVHGRRLMELGDARAATCVSCHPAHSIRPPSDPLSSVSPLNVPGTCARCHADAEHMESYGIATDQLERYQRSVHWEAMSVDGDLSAPSCNDCHGNHGAAPPGISWVGNVCGQCHSVMADMFAQSRHARTFALVGVPGCATCHNNHDITRASDELVGLGEGALCARCHSSADPGGQVASAMRNLIDSLSTAYHEADSILERAEQAGMEVSQPRFELAGASTALISARAAVHSFNVIAVKDEVEQGLGIAATAHELGLQATARVRFRRAGLAVSVVIILALVVGLVLKIRELERRGTAT
jgi:predicted CXXCH cytochrome family protein